jgi:phosphoglycolate phosphatase-like HAD superfamily hydrolase
MIIGVDLDNTMYKDDAIEIASRELGYLYDSNYHTSWGLIFFSAELQNRIRELWSDPEHMGNLTPLEGVKETLKAMRDAGNQIVVVTARIPELDECSRAMLRRDFEGLIDEVFVVGLDQNKTPLLKDIGVGLWIDDAPHQVLSTKKAGIKTVMISNNSTKYNWHVRMERGIIFRESIRDIEKEIWDTPLNP